VGSGQGILELAKSAVTTRRDVPGAVARGRPLATEVLRLLWSEKQISRAEIARRLDLSRSTVSEIVAGILPTGLVSEVGTGPSIGGRRPILLHFNDDAFCILGVEMGATHVAVALTDLRGRVLAWEHRAHPVRTDPAGTRALILELGRICLAQRPVPRRRLVGVGIAVPSPVDPRHPFALSEIVLPEWRGESGLEAVGAHFKVPVLVDNDANLGALAEHWWGAGRGVDDVAYVKVGTGIGSGHVIAGELYRGATGFAGEIGHLAIDPHGDACICGLRGCLALFVGAPALVARAAALRAEHPESSLSRNGITVAKVERAALDGDPLGVRVIREAAEQLGIAVAGMLNLMNPAVVIVGGHIAALGDLFMTPLRETVSRRTRVTSITGSSIVMSELGAQTVAIGAASLVLKAALDDPRLFPRARAARAR
jgi:predicted NBD/HSP70 family sugar kinase